MSRELIITCPKCGGEFEMLPSRDISVTCPHCSKKVVVPPQFRKKGRAGIVFLFIFVLALAGGGGYYFLARQKALAKEKARIAAERRARIDAEEAALAKKSEDWANILDAAKDDALLSESDFNRAMESLRSFQEKYPRETAQTSVVKEKILRMRGVAADKVMKSLRRKSAELLKKERYREVAELYRAYSGDFASDTSARRTEMAELYKEKAKSIEREAAESERRRAEARKKLIKEIVGDMTKQRYEEALAKVRASGDASLNSLKSALAALSHISDSVMNSFKDDLGKKIKIKLRNGTLIARVRKVENGALVAETSKLGAKVARRVKIKDLDYDEIIDRLASRDKLASAFFKGIVAMKKRDYDAAEVSFNSTGVLSSDLVAYLNSMKRISSNRTRPVGEKKSRESARSIRKVNYNSILTELKVSTLKKSIISGAGKKHLFKSRYSIKNMTGVDLKDFQMEILIIGENVLRKHVYKIIQRHSTDLDLKNSKSLKSSFEFTTVYYKDPDWGEWAENSDQENVGYKFVNWIYAIKNPEGKILKIKTRNKKFAKVAEKIVNMSDDTLFDKNARPVTID